MKKRIVAIAIALVSAICVQAQPGTLISLNEGWDFTRDHVDPQKPGSPGINWQPVSIPHSWNTTDVMDDQPGYYRGPAWYRRKLILHLADRGKQHYLKFEGANQVATVYINGRMAGMHTGGYTGFLVPIDPLLVTGNTDSIFDLLVKVDNSFNPQIPPLSADFTFFGGIYRDVWLLTFAPVHFSVNDHGSGGLFITTPQVSAASASVHLRGIVSNTAASAKHVQVSVELLDGNNHTLQQVQSILSVKARSETLYEQDVPAITQPNLWSPEDPYLYSIRTSIRDASSGELLDEQNNVVGFRWFRFDAQEGFFLNGKSYKLIGASRHQDRPGMGNAVPDALAFQDIQALKEMGGNLLRVAHYPQDPSILEACDRLGILASVEIPIVNEITESDTFYHNCAEMQKEMIRQNFNHPSVIIWCCMNEILLRPHFNNDKERQKIYFSHIAGLAKKLDSIARTEDPYRYTMIANHGDFDRYVNTGLTAIPMIVGWNLYAGWYGGELSGFPAFLDKHHAQLANKPMLVTEYGADADPRIRSLHPVRFDKSVEYTTRFHQYYLQEILKRPFVAGGVIWNLADFNSETREETMPHINNKGLLMGDRTPKDPYYFYQAMLSQDPFVKISSSYWDLRTGIADSAALSCTQPVQVASNLDSAELTWNGSSQGRKPVVDGFATWDVAFVNGINHLAAIGAREGRFYSDHAVIQFRLQPYLLRDRSPAFREMNILVGADRYFFDRQNHQIWQPDQAYRPGSWGYIGGQPFKMPGNTRLPYGSDKNIVGTDNDPVYQTQRTDITGYRLDLPPGEYELTLHFAELEGAVGKELAYNLSQASSGVQQSTHRRFHVFINEVLLLDNFDIAEQYGVGTAVAKKTRITVKDDRGIRIRFVPVEGQPVLNALQIRKIY